MTAKKPRPAFVALYVSKELKDWIKEIARREKRSLSAQCALWIEAGLERAKTERE